MKLTIRKSGLVGCVLNMYYSLSSENGRMIAEGVCPGMKAIEVVVPAQPMSLRVWGKQGWRVVEKRVEIRSNATINAVVATIKTSLMKSSLILPIIGLFKPTFSIDVSLDYL